MSKFRLFNRWRIRTDKVNPVRSFVFYKPIRFERLRVKLAKFILPASWVTIRDWYFQELHKEIRMLEVELLALEAVQDES